jgi:hypothetical protein
LFCFSENYRRLLFLSSFLIIWRFQFSQWFGSWLFFFFLLSSLFWVATLFHLDVSCHILQLLYLRLRPFLFSINWEEVPRRLSFSFCSYFTFHFGRMRLIAKLFEVGLPISIDIFFISLHKFRRSVSTLSLLSCVGSFLFFLGPENKEKFNWWQSCGAAELGCRDSSCSA